MCQNREHYAVSALVCEHELCVNTNEHCEYELADNPFEAAVCILAFLSPHHFRFVSFPLHFPTLVRGFVLWFFFAE